MTPCRNRARAAILPAVTDGAHEPPERATTPAFSARFEAALAMAARGHRDQLRKGTDLPYLTHPVHVAVILLRHGSSEELVLAGLLHDLVEDCGVDVATVGQAFGAEVARLVAAVSETKAEGGRPLPWEQRKAAQLERLRDGDAAVAALKAADAIHNASTIAADLERAGAVVWGRFKRGPGPTLAHYRSLLEVVRAKLGRHPLAGELEDAVAALAAASARGEA